VTYKVVKVTTEFYVDNRSDLTTNEQLAEFINQSVYDIPKLFRVTAKDIVHVNEYIIRGTKSPEQGETD
jgi:hypothetical protein